MYNSKSLNTSLPENNQDYLYRNQNPTIDYEFLDEPVLVASQDSKLSYTASIKESGVTESDYNIKLLIQEINGNKDYFILEIPKQGGNILVNQLNAAQQVSSGTPSVSGMNCVTTTTEITTPCGCGHYDDCNRCPTGNPYPATTTTHKTTCYYVAPPVTTFEPPAFGETQIGGSSLGIGGTSTSSDPQPIYIYEGEQQCFSNGTCTPPLYWAQVVTEVEHVEQAKLTLDDSCQKIPVLKNDNEFKQKMVDLKNATNQFKEKLFTVYDDPAPDPTDNFDYIEFEGPDNVPNVKWGGNTRIKGVIHSHFFEGLSVFSPDDLQDLYRVMSDSQVTDDFFYGVVTNEGTAYILQVNDRAAFLEFGNKYLSTDEKLLRFSEKSYTNPEEYNIGTDILSSANEKSFVKMLTELGAGLNVYKPTDLTFTDYKKLDYFNNELIPSNCD